MKSDEAAIAVIDALEKLKIPYMLVGSFASNFYGIPRATEDVDFVAQLDAGILSEIREKLGNRFRLNPQTSFETTTATRRYVLESIEESFSIELFLLSKDPHDRERFARRRRVRILDRKAYVSTVEDAIITKLRWYDIGRRTKDIQDARGMIAVQGERIDWDYVTGWCERHGTREILDRLRA